MAKEKIFSKLRGKEFNPVPLVEITNLTNEEWINYRETHTIDRNPENPNFRTVNIGGSFVGKIFGADPYCTKEEARDIKMGISPKLTAEKDNDPLETGHIFEFFVALNCIRSLKSANPKMKIRLLKDIFRDTLPYMETGFPDKKSYERFKKEWNEDYEELTKKWGINPNVMCISKDHPYATTNCDGFIEVDGQLGIFEAKTTSSPNAVMEYWEKGKIPPSYYWQLVFYMAVFNVDFAYITCCRGLTLRETYVVRLDRDLEVEDKMWAYLDKWVEECELGIPVEETDEDSSLLASYYYRKYGVPEERPEDLRLPSKFSENIEKIESLKNEIAELKKAITLLEEKVQEEINPILKVMEDNKFARIGLSDGRVKGIALSPSMTRESFDWNRFKEENPDVDVDSYKIPSVVKVGKDSKCSIKFYDYDDEFADTFHGVKPKKKKTTA